MAGGQRERQREENRGLDNAEEWDGWGNKTKQAAALGPSVSVFCKICFFFFLSLFHLSASFSLPFSIGCTSPPSQHCLSQPAPDPTSAGLSPPHVIQHSTENLTTTRQLDEALCRGPGRGGGGVRGGLCHRQHCIPQLRPKTMAASVL